MNINKIIGVIGGMGPQASAEFYRMLIDRATSDFGAQAGDQYPEIVLDSVPVPDCFTDASKLEMATQMLKDRVRRMTAFGASYIVMTCNTMHLIFPRLQSETAVPMISIIEEVSRSTMNNSRNVLLLASPTTLRTGMYQRSLKKRSIRFVQPLEEEYIILDSVIQGILSGKNRVVLEKRLADLVFSILSKNCGLDGVILGCTELPLVFPQKFRLPVYSSLSILAESVLKQYYTKEAV